MKRFGAYLTMLVLGYLPTAAADDIVVRTTVTPEQAWVGQRVIVQIDVLGDSGWAQITRLGALDLSGAYIMRTDSQGTRLQETIDGVSYTGQRYALSVYPQIAGTIPVPALPVEVTVKVWGPGATATVQQVNTPPATIISRVPPGAEDVSGLISTTRLTATQKWAPSIEAPKVGNALKRTIALQATDVSGMAFAPLQHEAIPGAGIYPAEPTVNDTADRGSLTGTRTEEVTYVLEQPGEVRIPDIRLTWWNVNDRKFERVELPGRILNVASGSVGTSDAIGSSAARRLETRDLWLLASILLLPAYLLLHFRRGIAQRWSAWRKNREESEARYFQRSIKSLRSGDADAALRDVMRWLDRINDHDRPARLEVFLRQYADASSREAVGKLSRNVARGEALSDPSPIIDGLSTARDRWRKARQPKPHASFELPELNRVQLSPRSLNL